MPNMFEQQGENVLEWGQRDNDWQGHPGCHAEKEQMGESNVHRIVKSYWNKQVRDGDVSVLGGGNSCGEEWLFLDILRR